MRKTTRLAAAAAVLALGTAALPAQAQPAGTERGGGPPGAAAHPADSTEPRVLVFSKTEGFRHDSIPDGIAAIQELGAEHGFAVEDTEDADDFTSDHLARYQAVVFLSTTGDVLNEDQQTAFEGYVEDGGGYVGVHAAADTEYDWPFYGGLVGAYFESHPHIQSAQINVEDHDHPATGHLDPTWERTDEWYDYGTNPRSQAKVLATLDESSYEGGGMGEDHPIAWCQTYEGGRAFYTGGGHTKESFSEEAFRQHLLGGIQYATGQVDADCTPEGDVEEDWQQLFDGTGTDGWKQAGPGSFVLDEEAGTLTSTGGMGLLWYEAKEFGAYSLKLDWRMAGDDNSGVFVGFPASDDPMDAVNKGYEIQIDATDEADRTTGAVYGFQSADIQARDEALNPPGEWNTYQIRVEEDRIQIWLNDTKINDFTSIDPERDLTSGHIGIQNHGEEDEVAFRDIRVQELGPDHARTPTNPESDTRGD